VILEWAAGLQDRARPSVGVLLQAGEACCRVRSNAARGAPRSLKFDKQFWGKIIFVLKIRKNTIFSLKGR
jgi:hypothetical protein